MDCLDLLIADHNRFRGTFARFREAHEAENRRAHTATVKTHKAPL